MSHDPDYERYQDALDEQMRREEQADRLWELRDPPPACGHWATCRRDGGPQCDTQHDCRHRAPRGAA